MWKMGLRPWLIFTFLALYGLIIWITPSANRLAIFFLVMGALIFLFFVLGRFERRQERWLDRWLAVDCPEYMRRRLKNLEEALKTNEDYLRHIAAHRRETSWWTYYFDRKNTMREIKDGLQEIEKVRKLVQLGHEQEERRRRRERQDRLDEAADQRWERLRKRKQQEQGKVEPQTAAEEGSLSHPYSRQSSASADAAENDEEAQVAMLVKAWCEFAKGCFDNFTETGDEYEKEQYERFKKKAGAQTNQIEDDFAFAFACDQMIKLCMHTKALGEAQEWFDQVFVDDIRDEIKGKHPQLVDRC